jgi:hypothetical protein
MLTEDDPKKSGARDTVPSWPRPAPSAWMPTRASCWRSGPPCKGLRRRRVRGEDPRQGNPHRAHHTSLSGTKIRKVALPTFEDHGEILKWLMLENVPGSFPYTAGTFAFKREGEDPTRMFAGEGDAFRTNRRFKLVSEGMPAKRLSTAFDSVTLYGATPTRVPTSTARSATPACRSPRWTT